jgi:hypothetical protein
VRPPHRDIALMLSGLNSMDFPSGWMLNNVGMSRYDLTDFAWRVIEPLLPDKPRGVPRVDDRRVLNGISGCYGQVRRGVICRSVMGRPSPATIASCDGERQGVLDRQGGIAPVLKAGPKQDCLAFAFSMIPAFAFARPPTEPLCQAYPRSGRLASNRTGASKR